jgi:thiol-disulfide isomerase/thioredoxin
MLVHVSGIALLLCLSLSAAPTLAQDKTDLVEAKMSDGDALLSQRRWEDALKQFKAANNLAEKRSAKAHLGMARAYQGLGAHKSAADSCTDALKLAGGDKALEAVTRNIRGTSLFALAEKIDDKRLKQAEEDFRATLALTATMPVARYNLGVVLLKQARDEEGLKELREYLTTPGNAADVAAAKRFIDNPRRARENYAPDFSVVTLEGSYISLDDLKGKVVLIDFWATWCGPCVTATPRLAQIQKNLRDKPFVILGISADRQAEPWKAFIEKHKLPWAQYLDTRGALASKFKVNAYPTYMLLDHEGIVRYVKLGWDLDVDGEIERQARKLLKEAEK